MKASKPIGTTATIVTFIVVGITGVLMFFDIKSSGIKVLHEYIGMAMVIACVLHIMANLTPFKKYFAGKKLAIMGVLFAASVVFIAATPNNPKPPLKDVYQNFTNLNLSTAEKIFGTNESLFNEYLNKNGLKFEDISVKEFAAKNNIKENDLVKKLLNK
ncbi:DUF4405 domain-containing protein [Campylobacter fetus]|uniref:DUF4405 domain-containing membrane protein n=5 Tax=Campylobacter fetus TaxID=196 RepID=A0AAE6IYT5_CAMFE|nr:DUF4405 domain-containing protein [Campylobacter fetus]OCS23201.1 hypothetical protein CFVI97532_00005 [Campylobacter fetus subsp. venerealis cfvi97/532]OCS26736.1 hypothetical protein CFVB10_02550 [Campylobacter fetus subsp. venerealis cfvB10]OCS30568.1 hypothetical protein CFVCCUG33900_00305 [Campylobacter fetus subsp. venerealis LMG 6570 = CCUG 33900]OCS38155.1 hypothetical protein CFVI02298_10055 [Campylobacter fetus subsp. venerealis cfvi02/298]ABK82295.1 hypothetical protein CFF8240_1